MMTTPPTGTVTFLFTDIEGSTKLWGQYPDAMQVALARHDAIMREAIETHVGYIVKMTGDGVHAAFATVTDALAACLAAQRTLTQKISEIRLVADEAHREVWPLRVRMGLHTGTAQMRDGDYYGAAVNRAARVMSVAHGGQILLSLATHALVRDVLPADITLRDMGEHRLKGLLNPERLWQVVAPDLVQEFSPLQSLNTIPNNLPIQVTSFIGREKEIAEVKQLLVGKEPQGFDAGRLAGLPTRLLTLTGSGGTGKTRLSLQVAAEVLDRFKDGVWFVELAPLADPALVPQTVANVLGIRDEPGQPLLATLIEWLRPKQLLLILDNCEHLIETCAKFADTILHSAPHVKVLASSREALGIAGETAYRVPSLECPNAARASHETVEQLTQYAAVQLFIERAVQSQTTFTVTNANAPAVAQICYRLDGIPLAIELAAARVRLFPPEQLAARLDDRFRLLTGGSRTALARQQTLRNAIDWSYNLLSEQERILLRRLSVFAGGWFFEAAESVCSEEGIEVFEVLDLLSRLVEKSLVIAEEVHGMARYHLLETIRQYARDKLLDSGESARVRAQHLAYFSRAVVASGVEVGGTEGTAWFEKLESDFDNFRTALDWSLESGDILPGLMTVGELIWLWWQRSPTEGLDRLRNLLSRREAQEHTTIRAQALLAEGYIRMHTGNPTEARRSLVEALAISRETGSERLTAAALLVLADAAIGLREYEVAIAYLTEGLDVARKVGSFYWAMYALYGFGEMALRQGNLEQAQTAFEETVTMGAHPSTLGMVLRRLGQTALRRAEYARAVVFIHESLTLNKRDRRGIVACLAALAAVRAAQGYALAASNVCGAVDALLETLHMKMMLFDQEEYEQTVATLRKAMPASTFDAAWAEGRALTLEQAIELAVGEPRG
jgi:predicted ATPase/class 3 adenylate cyclase